MELRDIKSFIEVAHHSLVRNFYYVFAMSILLLFENRLLYRRNPTTLLTSKTLKVFTPL
ncbi:hypothetical protein V7149_04885 [Bacillus sp. JJ1503]|uniref:hypothetical protein n=1 Tax=Bacillus sp. JJ1503 TaxID=3122956 RepID=UPI002FFDC230